MKKSLWLVIVVAVACVSFLIGYSVSSYTGIQRIRKDNVGGVESGGYGAESGGYGAESGGYGAESGGDGEEREESEDYGERTGYFGEK